MKAHAVQIKLLCANHDRSRRAVNGTIATVYFDKSTLHSIIDGHNDHFEKVTNVCTLLCIWHCLLHHIYAFIN